MKLSRFVLLLAGLSLVGCAGPSVTSTPVSDVTSLPPESSTEPGALKKANNGFLICKAKKSRFHYDWNARSLAQGQNEQNSVRYEFRKATRPAGAKGENLKVGECGWAEKALTTPKAGKKKNKSQVTFKSLSDEATQTFYKLRTGKVFKVPVRQTKSGLQAAPGAGVSVVR